MKSKTLIFHHIPKAGGTTLNAILRQNYKPRRMINIYDTEKCSTWQEFLSMPAEAKQRLQAVVGHMPFGAHRELPDGSQYITFFRDPVKRVVSLYQYVFRKKDHYLYAQAQEERFSMERFLEVAPAEEVQEGRLHSRVE